MALDILRRCRFRPYRDGPMFSLTIWDTHRKSGSHSLLGYRLSSEGKVIFKGEDFGCPSCNCVDSDATVDGIMTFLTLRPGDTDVEYFRDYSAAQFEFCSLHADALSCEVQSRFGLRE